MSVGPAILILLGAVVVGIVLIALAPGAGLFGGIAVLGVGVAAWLLLAGGTRTTPSEVAEESADPELLGPGGPDDPERAR